MPDENHSRLVAKLMRELLHTEVFETLADLLEATKQRCARLRIRYTAADLTNAMTVIASNRALVGRLPPATVRATPAPLPTRPPMPRDVSAQLLAMGRPKTFPDESRRMDVHTRLALATKLRLLAARKPTRFDPPECAYCGATTVRARGVLCGACVERLDRLDGERSAPDAPADFTFVARLPFTDDAA